MGQSICSSNNKVNCKMATSPHTNYLADGVDVYHERQVKELCALHALNNIFQKPDAFTQKSLDSICFQLTPSYFFNPHRSMLGLGNYDVNLLTAAVESLDHQVVWFDKRRREVMDLDFNNILGFILNIPSDYKLAGFIPLSFNRKHWIAIRKIKGVYYNLDSKLKAPEVIGDEDAVINFLINQLADGQKILLLVVTNAVADATNWCKKSTENGVS